MPLSRNLNSLFKAFICREADRQMLSTYLSKVSLPSNITPSTFRWFDIGICRCTGDRGIYRMYIGVGNLGRLLWCGLGFDRDAIQGCLLLHAKYHLMIAEENWGNYGQTTYISRTLVGNRFVDHSSAAGASPVGAAPTASSFPTLHLASVDWAKTSVRRDEKHVSVGSWCDSYQSFNHSQVSTVAPNNFIPHFKVKVIIH